MVLLISNTLIIGAITGFVFFNEGELFHRVAGQVADTYQIRPDTYDAVSGFAVTITPARAGMGGGIV